MSLKPQRPTAKHNPITGHAGANTVVSQCSRCNRTVWSWQPWVLSTGEILGIIHVNPTDCEEAGNA